MCEHLCVSPTVRESLLRRAFFRKYHRDKFTVTSELTRR